MHCKILHCKILHCTIMHCMIMHCTRMQSRLQRGLQWESWPLPTTQTWHNRPCNAPNLIYSNAAPKISNCQLQIFCFPSLKVSVQIYHLWAPIVQDLMGNIVGGNNKWEMWNNRSDKSVHNKRRLDRWFNPQSAVSLVYSPFRWGLRWSEDGRFNHQGRAKLLDFL